jgi:hypothetical protein
VIDFIPIEYYTIIYYNIILLVVFLTWLHTLHFSGFTRETFLFNKKALLFLFWFVLLYMGLRPLSGRWFGDMGVYNNLFNIYVNGGVSPVTSDIGFYSMM